MSRVAPLERVAAALRRRPLATSAALVAALAAVRAADVLVLRLHVRLGTLAPSAVAMLLVGAALTRRDGRGRSKKGLRRVLDIASWPVRRRMTECSFREMRY